MFCVPCQLGKSFSSEYSISVCIPCSSCSKDQVVIKNCTRQADIKCGKKCYSKDRYIMKQLYLKWLRGEGRCQGVLGITIPTQNLINCRIFLVWFWFIFKYPVFAHWLDNFSETGLIEIRLIVIVQGFNVSLILAASGAGMAQGWCSGVFSSHQVFLWVLQFSSLCKNPHFKFQSTCKLWTRKATWLFIAKLPFIWNVGQKV